MISRQSSLHQAVSVNQRPVESSVEPEKDVVKTIGKIGGIL